MVPETFLPKMQAGIWPSEDSQGAQAGDTLQDNRPASFTSQCAGPEDQGKAEELPSTKGDLPNAPHRSDLGPGAETQA